jgi:hypothetical protein
MHVVPLSRDSKDFYRLMGPIFGSREAAKEIGIHVYDDADKEWFVCRDGSLLIGCASLRGGLIGDCYVKPAYRGMGRFRSILNRVLLEPAPVFRATCTASSLPAFLSAGFEVVSRTKNFTRVIKNA